MNPSIDISNGNLQAGNLQAVPHPLDHQCGQYASVFEQSGSISEKLDAAGTIVELMSATVSIEEIRSCPRPHGFTLFHLIPMAKQVDETVKSALFERLMADAEMCTLVDQPDESINVERLWLEVNQRKIPLANGDRPVHVAVFAGSKEDVVRQLQALKQQGLKDCHPNSTGNNLFNIAASKSLELFNLVFDFYRSHEKFGEYITHRTNCRVTPTHHACRSTNADKLKVLARLLVAGAEHSLGQVDNRGMTPLDHLELDLERYSQLVSLVEQEPQLLHVPEHARDERLHAVKQALSSAFNDANKNKKMLASLAHGQKEIIP